jgi:hypothetical protein
VPAPPDHHLAACPVSGCENTRADRALFCHDCYARLPKLMRDQLQTIQPFIGTGRIRELLAFRSRAIAYLRKDVPDA